MVSKAAKRLVIGALLGAATVTAAVTAAWILRQRPEDPVMPESSELSSSAQESGEEEISLPPSGEKVVTVLLCGVDDAAQLTDVILYGRLDLEAGTGDLLQIPRDTYVGEEYPTGKINSVYSRGDSALEPVERLQKVLREQYGLACEHHLVLGLEAFREVVDAAGGVPMDVPARIEFLPGKVLEPGPQTLSGEQAEWFVRYRAGYAMGDIGRIQAQQLFLDAALRRAKDLGRRKLFSIAGQYYSRVDTDLPLLQGLSLANEAFLIDPDDVRMHLLPGNGVMHGGLAVYEADAPALEELLAEYFFPEGPLLVPQVPKPYIPPPSVPSSQASEPSEALEEETGSDAGEPAPEDPWEGEERWVWEDP